MQCRSERGNQKNQQPGNRHRKQRQTCSAGFSHRPATFDRLQEAIDLDWASWKSRVSWEGWLGGGYGRAHLQRTSNAQKKWTWIVSRERQHRMVVMNRLNKYNRVWNSTFEPLDSERDRHCTTETRCLKTTDLSYYGFGTQLERLNPEATLRLLTRATLVSISCV